MLRFMRLLATGCEEWAGWRVKSVLRQGPDSLILKTIAPRQCAAYTLMCCYAWCNWLVTAEVVGISKQIKNSGITCTYVRMRAGRASRLEGECRRRV